MKVEIEVVTGFLGAGKTAFINSLIKQTYVSKEKILVITLEKGNSIIHLNTDNTYEVKNIEFNKEIHCFDSTLIEIISRYKPNRIIIEFNGTERFETLLFILYSKDIVKVAKLNCIYFITDVKSFKMYLSNMEELLLPCIENSSLIVLNNCINVDEKEIKYVTKLVKERNLNGHIITAENNDNLTESIKNSKLFIRSFFRKICILRSKNQEVIRWQ